MYEGVGGVGRVCKVWMGCVWVGRECVRGGGWDVRGERG